jgi:hypothetical protein
MNIQDVFYLLGIVFMTFSLGLLLTIVIFLFYVRKKANEFYQKTDAKVKLVKSVMSHPKEIATALGATFANKALHKVSDLLSTKKTNHARAH